jgi:hypothetical protein
MLDFQYTKLEGILAIPIVKLYFENPDNPSCRTSSEFAVLDTGSDITIVPYTIISELKTRELTSTQKLNIKVLGRECEGAPYLVKVGFSENNYIYAKVFAIPNDILDNQVIIGRDILNLYVITLNGPKLTFTISE